MLPSVFSNALVSALVRFNRQPDLIIKPRWQVKMLHQPQKITARQIKNIFIRIFSEWNFQWWNRRTRENEPLLRRTISPKSPGGQVGGPSQNIVKIP